MLVIGIVLSFVGLGFFCWLLFTLTVHALPFFAGVTAGLAAYHYGSGVIGVIVVGLIGGLVTLAAGRFAFTAARSPHIRAAIAFVFAASAAVAGYHATLGLAQIGVPAGSWRQAFALVGAAMVGMTAWVRMALNEPLDVGRGVVRAGLSPFGGGG